MVDMEPVRQFNSELSTIYETKPPISKGKVSSITRLAVKAIKYYKHVVQSVEKFTQKNSKFVMRRDKKMLRCRACDFIKHYERRANARKSVLLQAIQP